MSNEPIATECIHGLTKNVESTKENGYATIQCKLCGMYSGSSRWRYAQKCEEQSTSKQSRAEWPGTQYQEAQLNTKSMGNCLLEADKVINGERQDEYGNPENSFQIIAEYWTTFLKHKYGLSTTLTPLDITNMMVLFKQARKIGQRHKRDNYVDSCGYEAIGADRLS